MIYNSLKILPIVVFFEILETKNINLLVKKRTWFFKTYVGKWIVKWFYKELTEKELHKLWDFLYDEYKTLDPNNQNNKTLKLSQKIDSLITKFKAVRLSVECLKTKRNDELINSLKKDGYKLSDETFKVDLERIEREAQALLLRAETFKRQLPKQDKKEANIFDVMASYSLILGFDLDYYSTSVLKFFAIQNQVEIKIKVLENNG